MKRAKQALTDADKDTTSLAAQQRIYRDVTGMLAACRKEFPANAACETLLKSYQQRNAPVLQQVNNKLMAKTDEHTDELENLQKKLEKGGKTQQVFEAAKFAAGGGASRYAANMSVAMSGLAEKNHKADSEKCSVLAEELSTGKHNLVAPA